MSGSIDIHICRFGAPRINVFGKSEFLGTWVVLKWLAKWRKKERVIGDTCTFADGH